MIFSAAQQATFKTWLLNNAAGLSDIDAAALANQLASPSYFVWNDAVPKSAVDAAITKANYTPADAIPGGPTTDLTYLNRAFVCQLKQTNALWMTQGVGTIDARPTNTRQIFADCLGSIPSGASGANLNAGWNAGANPGAVRLALMRQATKAEVLFVVAATGPGNDGIAGNRGTNTNPDICGTGNDGNPLEGPVTQENVAEARAS